MLKIWGRANSSNVQKILWCCEELGIRYERIDAGGKFGRTGDAEYLAKNPNGLVPTVEDGEVVLWESNTILRYLATTSGGARLYPTNPVARADVERWMDWQLASVNAPMGTLLMGLIRGVPESAKPEVIAAARDRAEHEWRILDGWLKDRPYPAGANFSLADIALGMFAYRWFNFPITRAPLPALEAWYERLQTRPGYQTHIMQPIT